jgi:threonine dehydratase
MSAFTLPTLQEIEAAAAVVYREFQPTPQYRWALLGERLGTECWVKHENHLPVGAFKIRGGLCYFDALKAAGTLRKAVVSATRGNHGQSIGWAARSHEIACTLVVPEGNSSEKNAAMRSLGVQLVEHGRDFQESREHALQLAVETEAHLVPLFQRELVLGVSTYWLEFFRAVPDLDVVYVPIGLGSGACAAIAAKLALGHRARVVGVISALATTYADALEILKRQLDHIVQVSDGEVAQSMRDIYVATHNVAEGAGAASFAGAMQEREQLRGQVVGTTLCGGNVDAPLFARVLSGAL